MPRLTPTDATRILQQCQDCRTLTRSTRIRQHRLCRDNVDFLFVLSGFIHGRNNSLFRPCVSAVCLGKQCLPSPTLTHVPQECPTQRFQNCRFSGRGAVFENGCCCMVRHTSTVPSPPGRIDGWSLNGGLLRSGRDAHSFMLYTHDWQ